MKEDAAYEQAKGSQQRKEARKRVKQEMTANLKLEKEVAKTAKGSAGSKSSEMTEKRKSKEHETNDKHRKNKEEKIYDENNDVNDVTSMMPSPTADDIMQECFETNNEQCRKSADPKAVDETHSYSTGSVASLSSDNEAENLTDEGHLAGADDSDSETENSAKSTETSILPATKTHNSSYEPSESPSSKSSKSSAKASWSPISKSPNSSSKESSSPQSFNGDDDNVLASPSAVNENLIYEQLKESSLSPTPMLETKTLDESPKAISLISCSDDSFTPIRRSGKKRVNMFEESDSEAELNEAAEQANDNITHYERHQQQKAKRIKTEDNLEDACASSPSTEPATPKEHKSRSFVSDFDQMMQKRRKERGKPHARRHHMDFITKNDDLIEQLIDQMEDAAYEDRCLNEQGLPATKKVAMLKLVTSQLIKKDLQPLFLEHNILGTLAEWLSPLPSKCLPCLQIRECILHILEDLPAINAAMLKESGIGKTLMFLCKHPEETKKNRECCRRLIAQWARPIYNLTCDYRAMSRAERQERDIELSLRYKKQVADKTVSLKKRQQPIRELEEALRGEQNLKAAATPQRPGDHGWVPRARVPQPSTKDYVHRPQSILHAPLTNRLKPQPNRYEAMAKKHQNAKRAKGAQHSKVGLSIFGNKT